MFKKILLATDFSEPSIAAREAALSLARKCLGHIQTVHVVSYVEDIYDTGRFLVPDMDLQNAALKEMEKFLPPTEYPNSGREVLVGSVAHEILKYARNGNYNLIVAGAHGRSRLGRVLLGSVTQGIIRDSEIPVMVVKDVRHSIADYQGFDRVLCPTDFSDTSMKSLDFAVRFANFLKADFDLVHVVDVPSLNDVQAHYSVAIPNDAELNTDRTLRQLLENRELIGKVRVATLYGNPDQQILKYGEENRIDFIVMGAHRKTAMERILLGGVTASVVARSGIPVITISPLA